MAASVSWPSHGQRKYKENLLDDLNRERFQEENLCDATLQVDDKQFMVHKCIVGKASLYFRKLFKVNMKEKYDSFANMKGLTSKIMESVLTYIYTGSVEIALENVFDVLAASEYLLIDGLALQCSYVLANNLDVNNCIKFYSVGKQRKWILLKKKAEQIFVSNFKVVCTQQVFLSLPKEDVVNILSQVEQDTTGFTVKDVLKAIIAWVKHDNKRKACLLELMHIVKLKQLSVENLESVLNVGLVKEVPALVELLREEIEWKLHCSKVFSEFWKKLPNLPNNATAGCVVAYQDYLYVIGGNDNPRGIQRLSLNEKKAVWERAGKTLHRRKYSSAVVDNDILVISGGYTGIMLPGLNAVETYRKSGLKVEQAELCSMNHARSGHSMVKCSGSLYCFGGQTEMLTEVYNNQTWKVVDKQRRLTSCYAVTAKNEIYVFSHGHLAFEEYNTMFNMWRQRCKCPVEYTEFAASYMNGKIYTFGRVTKRFCNDRCILAEYDIVLDTWKEICSSPYETGRTTYVTPSFISL